MFYLCSGPGDDPLDGSSIQIDRCTSSAVYASYRRPSGLNDVVAYEVILNCTQVRFNNGRLSQYVFISHAMPRVYCMHMQSEGLPTVYVCNDRDVIGSILRVDSSTFSLDVTAIEAPAEGLTCTVKGCVTVSNVWHYISNENSCVIGGECVHDITMWSSNPAAYIGGCRPGHAH